jgi:eukaryotic-like serine/threonine-protein kinase
VTIGLQEQLRSTLGSGYAIERELVGGGMSRVFVATEMALRRKVVVKVLPPELAAEVNCERFTREIRLAAQLQHPHIVPLLSAGEMGSIPYFTMPFIEGESLRVRLQRSGELPIMEAVRILREVASALAHAHERGVVHRDIKPDNVLMAGGSALVTDFGVAKALDISALPHGDGSVTSRGIALGTPAYMAPEQAAADPAIDHRADIYAFGILAYELLTGETPFAGRPPHQMLAAHIAESPEPIQRRRPSVPSGLAALVARCLEKRAADRPQRAADVVNALDSIATPSDGSTPAISPAWAGILGKRTRHILAAGGVAAVVATVAAAGYYAIPGEPARSADHRVHVGEFANHTGDPALLPIGTMASDWIVRELSETGVLEVVPAGAAGNVVTGAFYRRGDTLQFLAQIADAATGTVRRSFGPISAPTSDPLEGIESLRGHVAGALSLMVDPDFIGLASAVSPPTSLAAYRGLREGLDAAKRHDHAEAVTQFTSAAAVDQSLHFATIAAAASYHALGECETVDSVGAVLSASRSRLTRYEAQYIDEVVALCRGDAEAAYRAARRKVELAPQSDMARFGLAAAALGVGRPGEAVRIFGSMEGAGTATHGRIDFYFLYARALHLMGEFRRELRVVREMRDAFPDLHEVIGLEIRALAALGRIGELQPLVDRALAGAPASTLEWATDELRAHGHSEAARSVASQLADWIRERPEGLRETLTMRTALARALYNAERIPEARVLVDSLVENYPGSSGLLGLQGRVAARSGDRVTAEAAAAALTAISMESQDPGNALTRARIAALLGERDVAMRWLRESVAMGEVPLLRMREDPDLQSLRDYPPFVALVRPVG